MLGVTRVTLYAWRRRGVFPAGIRVGEGRSVRWRVEDFERWLETRPTADLVAGA